MRKPEDGKKVYDQIEIPEELGTVVNSAIASADKEAAKRKNRNKKIIHAFRNCSAAAAAVAVCMVVGLNTSEVFAKEMGELPLIGPIAKVLTIRSYEEKTEDYDIKVDVPEIPVVDGVAEKFRCFLLVSPGKVQDDAGLVALLPAVGHEVVDQGVVLGSDAGVDGGVCDEGFYLFWGEVPEAVDLFSGEHSRGNVAADGPVRQTGDHGDGSEVIVISCCLCIFHKGCPFDGFRARCTFII